MRGKEILDNWRFYLGEPEGAHLLATDDTAWRTIDLPHDWSVEFSFDKEKGEACTGFLVGGIGWYRKHIITTENMIDKKVVLNFDGIYSRGTIYCNGEVICFHPNGYTPVLADITDYLKPVGEDNVVAVRVDHSRYADSRWYTGSGIYRKVSMHILPKIHIPIWGINITTPVIRDNTAEVEAKITVQNEMAEEQAIEVMINILDQDAVIVAKEKKALLIEKQSSSEIKFNIDIKHPRRWEIHDAYNYIAEATVLSKASEISKGSEIQKECVRFGVREFKFDADKGFFFNGVNQLIKGVCLHHDAGLVGAAVPLDVWKRRLELLKACGCNAIRTAHNPVSEDFLDLCDEMGFLVQEEFFDEWDNPKDKRRNGEEKTIDYWTRSYTEFFRDYARKDLQNTMLRDRNHPCIFQWSLGNEIEWTYTKYNKVSGYFANESEPSFFYRLPPNSLEKIRQNILKIPKHYYDIGSTAHKLSEWTKEMDVTRPVIANCILPTVSYETGFTDALDIVGYSYRRVIYDYGHENYPKTPIMGTENVPQWHEWKAVLEHEHIPGTFLWTGIDHMGEAWVQGPWPRKGSNVGLIDLAGFEKPSYHMFKTLWNEEPHIKIFTQALRDSLYQLDDSGELVEKEKDGWQKRLWFWHDVNPHWNYENHEETVVEVYSNCDEVSLWKNDVLIGTRYLNECSDHIYKWYVPFEEGNVKAIGKKDGKIIEEVLCTTGPIHEIALTADKNIIKVNCDSAVHITAQFYDINKSPIKVLDDKVCFEVTGSARILGVDNGRPENFQDFQSSSINTADGRCLMILQAIDEGDVIVNAYCPKLGIKSNECRLTAV